MSSRVHRSDDGDLPGGTRRFRRRIALVGTGRLGRTVLQTWPENVVAVATRRPALRDDRITVQPVGLEQLLEAGEFDVLWIAVPDSAIAAVADRVLKAGLRRPTLVLHSSGALGTGSLQRLEGEEVTVAALHPNLILDGEKPFPAGAVWGFTGDAGALQRCRELLAPIDPQIVKVAEENRPLYHAAATFVANYSLVLADLADRLYRRSGLDRDRSRQLVCSYLSQSIESIRGAGERGLLETMTGPLARGDSAVLEDHDRSLRDAGFTAEAELLQALIRVAGGEGASVA